VQQHYRSVVDRRDVPARQPHAVCRRERGVDVPKTEVGRRLASEMGPPDVRRVHGDRDRESRDVRHDEGQGQQKGAAPAAHRPDAEHERGAERHESTDRGQQAAADAEDRTAPRIRDGHRAAGRRGDEAEREGDECGREIPPIANCREHGRRRHADDQHANRGPEGRPVEPEQGHTESRDRHREREHGPDPRPRVHAYSLLVERVRGNGRKSSPRTDDGLD